MLFKLSAFNAKTGAKINLQPFTVKCPVDDIDSYCSKLAINEVTVSAKCIDKDLKIRYYKNQKRWK